MNALLLEQCRAYLMAHAYERPDRPNASTLCRAVTISRETGAGALSVGTHLVDYLESRQIGNPLYPWAVFDREIVREVLRDRKLPESLERYLPEDTPSRVSDVVEDLLGLHPSTWSMVQHTTRTMLRLAAAGNVILVGRGANLVAAHLKHVLHVRLIAPLDQRIRHIEEYYQLSHREAAEFVRKNDRARLSYVHRHFRNRARNPLHYHLTINTGRIPYREAARIIAGAVAGLPTA